MQRRNWVRSVAWCALACALSFAGTSCDNGGDAANAPEKVERIGSALTSGALKIACGGPAVSPFIADTNFTGGSTVTRSGNVIDMTAVNGYGPAPTAVYQSQRFDTTSFSYTLTGLGANTWNKIRLHFADTHWSAAGQRVFNVKINTKTVLSNFDIIKTVGAGNKALIEEFTVQADANGQYALQFIKVTDAATVSGIEVAPTTTSGVRMTANGTAYAKLCAQSLVPLPPNFGGSGGTGTKCTTCMAGNGKCEGCVTGPNGEWKYSGQLTSHHEQSFNGNAPVDIFYYESTNASTPGLCMMAMRQGEFTEGDPNATQKADFAGVICQAASGAVCFWDLGKPTQFAWNANAGIPDVEQGHVTLPSTAKVITSTTSIPSNPTWWVGGNDLIEGSTAHVGQEACADCHEGRNAFVNHPGTATDLFGLGRVAASNWMPAAWPAPIVPTWDPGRVPLGGPWPLNPGPQSLASFPSTMCEQCHNEQPGNAGSFPALSLANPFYSSVILTKATQGVVTSCDAGDIHCPNGAMPPFPISGKATDDQFVAAMLTGPGAQSKLEFRTQLAALRGSVTLVNGPGTVATSPFTYGLYGRAATYGINSQNKIVAYDPVKMQWRTIEPTSPIGTASKVAYSQGDELWMIRQSGTRSYVCEALANTCYGKSTCEWNCDSIGYSPGYSQIVASDDMAWVVDKSGLGIYATSVDNAFHYGPDSFFAMGTWPSNDPIGQVSIGPDGDLWILSTNGNLKHQTGGTFSATYESVTGPPGGGVVSVSVANANSVWVASSSGLYKFLPASRTWEKHCLTTGCGLGYTKVSAGGNTDPDIFPEVWALDGSGNAYRVDPRKGSTQASISKINGATLSQLSVGGLSDALGITSGGAVYSFQ